MSHHPSTLPTIAGSTTTESGNVLVVGPDHETLETVIAELGYSIERASAHSEALEKLQSQEIDLLLVTSESPDAEVFELLERVKQAPEHQHLPVIFLGSASEPGDISRCIQLGAEDCLIEPIDPGLLRSRIFASVHKKRRHDRERSEVRKMEQLSHDLQQVILPLGISLSVEKDLDRLLEKILLESKAICNSDAATLYLRTKDDRLKFLTLLTDSLGIALGGTTGREIPFPPLRMYHPETGEPNHHNIATHVALTGQSVNIPDIYSAVDFDFSATKVFDARNNYRSISTLTVPLKDNRDEVIAVIQLLNSLDPETGEVIEFDSYQQLVVESLASQAAVAFNNQLLLQRQEELLKFERDLQIGRQIQAGFLPDKLPQPSGWEIAAQFRPAREVAGDFFDVFELAHGRVGLVICDVCDKGVGAALFMALVRSLIRVYAQQRYAVCPASGELGDSGAYTRALKETVVLTNRYVSENHLEMNMFATAFCAVLDPTSGTLAYVNCGHNAPYICDTSGIRNILHATGPAIGILPDFDFGVVETALMPGDLLFAFTDGVTDARDSAGHFFGEPRLRSLIEDSMPTISASGIVRQVIEDLLAHIGTATQYDDITMLAAQRAAAG